MSGDDVSCVNYLFFTYNITNIIKKTPYRQCHQSNIKVMLMSYDIIFL